MTWQEVRQLADYSFQSCSGEADEVIRRADRLCRNEFLFDRRWDMEPTQGSVVFDGPIRWDHMETGDTEWPVMLARQSYLYDVALAYLLTEQSRYLNCFLRIVTEFIENCPFCTDPDCHSWRTLDAGIRATVWVRCLAWLRPLDVLPETFLASVRGSLAQHFTYLYGCMDHYHLLSNWGVLANTGAVFAGVWLAENDEPGVQEKIPVLLDRLACQAEMQILRDGMQWEQSPMYHHEVLWCFLELILLAREKHLALPPSIPRKAHAMCRATLYEAKPNFHQPMRGDSDDTDVRDVLTLGAFLFDDPLLRSGAYALPDLENLWRFGMQGALHYASLPAGAPPKRGHAFRHSGNYCFRAGSGPQAAWVHFHCGPLGSGHGHADLLHLDVTACGVDILTDTGRLTYVNDSRRTGLKAPAAHNTFVIDGEDFTDCCASWRFGAIAKPIKGEFHEDARYGYVSGMHLGYAHRGLFVRREVVFLKPGVLVVFDSFFGSGAHTCRQTFHFGPGQTALTADGATFSQNGVHARIQSFASGARLTLDPQPYAPLYNLSKQTACLTVSSGFRDGGGILTVIGFAQEADFAARKLPVTRAIEGTQLPDGDAQALEICCGQNRWTVLFSRQEIVGKVNLLCAGGCRGYGEAIVFDRSGHPTVLSW